MSAAAEGSTRTPTPGYAWGVVGMLWLVCLLNYADRQAIFSVFPVLERELGFDKAQLGLIGSAFMWVYAAGAPFAGYLCDRLRRKELILGGCLFWSGVTGLTGVCGNLWQFLAVRALEGFGETFYFPASMALISDYHGPKTRSRALSVHQSSVYAGTILGSWLGAWFAEGIGWRWGFLFFGAAGAVLALALWRFLREPRRGAAEELVGEPAAAPLPRETAAAVFRSPAVPLLMGAFVCANAVATVFLTWTPTYLVERFHFKLTAAGLSGSVFIQLASAASVPLAGVLADRFARVRPGGRALIQAFGLAVGAGFVFLLGSTRDVGTLLAAMVGFGLAKGFYDSGIFAALYDVVEPRARGAAAGLMNTVGWGGGALGPLVVGWLAVHGRHATEMENMGEAIAGFSLLYVVGAILLAIAALVSSRKTHARPG